MVSAPTDQAVPENEKANSRADKRQDGERWPDRLLRADRAMIQACSLRRQAAQKRREHAHRDQSERGETRLARCQLLPNAASRGLARYLVTCILTIRQFVACQSELMGPMGTLALGPSEDREGEAEPEWLPAFLLCFRRFMKNEICIRNNNEFIIRKSEELATNAELVSTLVVRRYAQLIRSRCVSL